MTDPLAQFTEPTRAWFTASYQAPTPAQAAAWRTIGAGEHTLVVAPTGSGKTLAAFLWSLDQLLSGTRPEDPQRRTRVLYISPLKALAVDVERNLRAPLAGIRHAAARQDAVELPEIRIGVRSGDTPAADRRRLVRTPPDILITTPESLFLMLTSAARESLRGIDTVIVDEVHALAGGKRGAHLALSLERLDALLDSPAQRVGLSATVRPHDEVARFLGGVAPARVVAPAAQKEWDLQVVVPHPDMSEPDNDERSVWPQVEERVADLVTGHRSTIVFTNSRRLAERLTSRLNEIADERGLGVLARAHHGSVAKEQRAAIEDDLKRGLLPCVVATSSLELGIDMGAVDLVVQIESPPSVASALQRVGRAGHQVGEVSAGALFPTHRSDLLPTAVTVRRMRTGDIEALRVPSNPLDVLAQQVVAACALESWQVDDLYALVTRSAPFAALPRSVYEATLDLLAGRYPSDDFAELRPRLTWDRVTGTLTGRPGSQRLAVTSGGTIPDRGLFGVFLDGASATGSATGRRVGELDEEMVYESRIGDVFTLGTSGWRITDITHDRVLVVPAPGVPGRLPFWKGDTPARPFELGAAIGAFARELESADDPVAIATGSGLDQHAVANLIGLVTEQREATGSLPTDRRIVVERFRDELGDWRLVVHSPYGAAVHAPWALAINARLRERYGIDGQAVAADDGIVVRIPDTEAEPPDGHLVLFDADEITALVTTEVGGSALFAARFRECAARALLLPRRDPGRRSPLWQQRQRASQLLEVAAKHPSFPIVLETLRECLQDVYDLPGLIEVLRRIGSRQVRVVDVVSHAPSPYAKNLLFSYVAQFMYEGDSPIAERRAAALTLDQGLLAELLGTCELRELLDPAVLTETEAELQRTAVERRARDAEGIADLLRLVGPLSIAEVAARATLDPAPAVAALQTARRVVPVRIAGEERWAVVEDVARMRDALGVPVPPGTPAVFTEPVDDPLGDLIGRYARCHGPFTAAEVATRYGLGAAVVDPVLRRLAAGGRLVSGEFRPTGAGVEWCDADVLRRLRRRSLARLRREVEPVDPQVLARFLPAWHHVGGRLRGVEGVLTAVEQLAGAALPASALESLVLPARVVDYAPSMLDELTTAGEVLWVGEGALPGNDGWVSLHLADSAAWTLPAPGPVETPLAQAVADRLAPGGGWFLRQVADGFPDAGDGEVAEALWQLLWSGRVTGDTLAPLRSRLASGGTTHRSRSAPPRGRGVRRTRVSLPVRPDAVGRWSALPAADGDATRRSHALAESLLERHGVVTRGAVTSEGPTGGFAAAYRVLSAFEDAGHCRRGYFVAGLGAAQFATTGAVDRLRTFTEAASGGDPVLLAATDPANPYGAALPWPARRPDDEPAGHRPGRKAGAVVVLVDGALVLYVERGGRTLLTWSHDEETLVTASTALAAAVRRGALGRFTVSKADGAPVLGSGQTALRSALERTGFILTPRGLRLRG
ncbi:Lhr family helicase [Nocardioides limicola]|uniref:Lhr family helicase n=1 Tax=Nocardioides limicola TaxID=2803368 RepID=UPI0027DB04A0|nr:DEAD/DEAH box helicase [Nocardioides sp. DJM-14]